MNLNSDLGEGASDDEAIFTHVDSASVGCGVHAGSLSITIATAMRCRELGLEVGAHPGYDDHASFGRVELPLTVEEIEALVAFQVAGLAAVVSIGYVKPHGALYLRCQLDGAAADAVVRVARKHGVGVVGQPGFELVAAAARGGIPGYREGFADRLHMPDGSLAPRDRPGSVLDPQRAAEQGARLAKSGRFDTICIHGDSPGAAQVAAAVREALRAAGVATRPLSTSRAR